MTSKLPTRIYLSAALLAALFYPAGPALADRLEVGDSDGPSMYQPPTLHSSQPQRLLDPFAPYVKPQDEDDFGPGSLREATGHDPDTSDEMKKRWDNWHKLVSDVIHERFANSVWQVCPHSPPLSCEISYVVARDGRVGNVRVLQPSTNVIFDNLAINIIRCIRMNPVLDFPSAAKRKFVQKTLTFTWEGSTVEAQPEKPQAVQILLGPCDFPPEDPPHIGPGQVCK